MLEMDECCGQEQEMNRDESASDDDSISLLCNLNACPSNSASKDTEMRDLEAKVGTDEQEEEMEIEINRLKAPESGIRGSSQPAAARAPSASHSDISNRAPASQCVKMPTKKGLHKRNEKGETLLHRACRRKDLAQVKQLIQAGIGINVEDYAGWTALHEACSVGSEAVVEELLKAGAHVNALACNVAPLHDAVAAGHYEVVKLLLQHGSDTNIRTLGRSALDLTEEENIKQLLLTCRKCLVVPEESCACRSRSSPPQQQQAGDASSRAQCQSSFAQGHNDTANPGNPESRESGDRDGAREPGDIQLRGRDTSTDNLSRSDKVTVSLEAIERKQTEISTWPLTAPEDADRYHSALVELQSALTELLAKQHQEKERLAQKLRTVPKYFWQTLLKKQLQSLASRQMTLVNILQKNRHLVQLYQDMKARLATEPPTPPCSTAERQQSHQVSAAASKSREAPRAGEDSHTHENQKQVLWTLRSAAPSKATERPACRLSASVPLQQRKTVTCTDMGNTSTSSPLSSVPKPGDSSQHRVQTEGCSAAAQSSAADNNTSLWKLIQKGVLPPGSTLQLRWKGQRRSGKVLPHGSIGVRGGKSYQSPGCWLAALGGNSFPADSALAWDKVMFRDKPLSHYLLNLEAGGTNTLTCPADVVGHCKARSSQDGLTTAETPLDYLMKVKNIILVEDNELLPSAVMDYYWEKLLKSDCLSDDWDSDFI